MNDVDKMEMKLRCALSDLEGCRQIMGGLDLIGVFSNKAIDSLRDQFKKQKPDASFYGHLVCIECQMTNLITTTDKMRKRVNDYRDWVNKEEEADKLAKTLKIGGTT